MTAGPWIFPTVIRPITYLSGNPLKEASSVLAPAFADELCVGQANVPLGDIAFAEGEKAGLFQLDSGEILYAQGIYDKIYPASITKIMTALLAIEYGNMEDVVTIQAEDVNSGRRLRSERNAGGRSGDDGPAVLYAGGIFRQ